MANFCENCGTKLYPGAAFCPECGAKIEQNAPAAQPQQAQPVNQRPGYNYAAPKQVQQPMQQQYQQPSPQQQYRQPQYQYQQPQSGQNVTPKRKNSFVILTVFLAVILAIEGVIACFWFPGFFNPQSGSGGIPGDSGNSGDTADDARYPLSIEDIIIDYTDEEIAAAPAVEMSVSEEHPTASSGDITVDFGKYNLSGEDTLTVKTLPLHKNEKAGYWYEGYDLSLSSGADEFLTEVEITIPREEGDGELVQFITQSHETGENEEVYFEISDDGKSYTLYKTHFSGVEKVVVTDFSKALKDEVQKGDVSKQMTRDALSTFYYPVYTPANKRMTARVAFSAGDLWSKMSGKYTYLPETDSMLSAMAKAMKAGGMEAVDFGGMMVWDSGTIKDKADAVSNAAGVAGGANDVALNVFSMESVSPELKQLMTKVKGVGDGFVGKTLAVFNIISTAVGISSLNEKIDREAREGKYKSDAQAVWENRREYMGVILGIVGSGVGAAGAITAAGTAPVGLTLVGVACAAGGLYLYFTAETKKSNLKELDENEKNYRDYYSLARSKSLYRTFYYGSGSGVKGDSQIARGSKSVIRELTSLNEKQNKRFAELVNTEMAKINKTGGFYGAEPRTGWSKEFATVCLALYNVLKDTPEKMGEAFTEFFNNYANACWENIPSDEDYLEFSRKAMELRGSDPNSASLPWKDDESKKNIQKQYSERLANELFAAYSDMFLLFARKSQHAAQLDANKSIREDILPLLNTQMEFRVEDHSIDDPTDLSKSVYGADRRVTDGNIPGYVDPDGEEHQHNYKYWYDYPMSFRIKKLSGEYERLDAPLFLPGQSYSGEELEYGPTLSKAVYADYYPNTDGFIPYLRDRTGNVVFRCSYFHWLMMGAPTAMGFKDVSNKGNPTKFVDFEIPKDPDPDGVLRINISVTAEKEAQPESSYTLHMNSDSPSGYDPGDPYSYYYEDKGAVPDASALTLNDDGTADLSVQSLNVTWKHTVKESESISTTGTETVTYKNSGFSVKGKLAYTYEDEEYGKTVNIHKYYILTDCPAISGSENVVNNYTYYTGASNQYSKTKTGAVTKTLDAPVLYEGAASIKPEKGDDLRDYSDKYKGCSYFKLTYDASGKKLESVYLDVKGDVTEDINSDYRGVGIEEHKDAGFLYSFKPVG